MEKLMEKLSCKREDNISNLSNHLQFMILSGLSLWADQHPRNVRIIVEDVSIPG